MGANEDVVPARQLREAGGPPDALGLQSHTGGFMRMADLQAYYDEMATAGFPLHVTEFNAFPDALAAKLPRAEVDRIYADYVEKYLTVSFAHPALDAFFFWGFMDTAVEWNDERSGHELRPVYDRVKELIQRTWSTRERATTSSEGRLRFRGFFGDYALRYPVAGGATRGVEFRVQRGGGGPLTLRAPFAARS